MQIEQGRYLSNYLRSLLAAMEHTVQTTLNDQLIEKNKDSYIDTLVEKYFIDPIHLHLDRKEITTHQKTIYARDLSPDIRFGRGINLHDPRPLTQTALTCHLPFSGNAELLKFDPTYSNRLSLPNLTIVNGEICFEAIMNDYRPEESGQIILNYIMWIQQQVDYINTDLVSYNSQLRNHIQRAIEQKSKSINRQLDAIAAIGIPLRKEIIREPHAFTSSSVVPLNDKYYSTAISYSSFDENVATQINTILEKHGIKTWFYPKSSLPGQKLHRMMTNMISQADRIILICSRSSLLRSGVLNELELTLAREAKEGGSDLLIPITLDNYVFEEWEPKNPDHAIQVRNRNIFRINNNFESDETQNTLEKLLRSLCKIK